MVLALAKGADPKACMAGVGRKATGLAKGKGGSMHFLVKNIFGGGHGIVVRR